MNTIRSFTAEDATIIYGSVIEDSIGEHLRVTIVATGLGGAARSASPRSRSCSAPAPTTVDGRQLRGARTARRVRRRRDQTVDALRHSAWKRSTYPPSCAAGGLTLRRRVSARLRSSFREGGTEAPTAAAVSRRPCPPSLRPAKAGPFPFRRRGNGTQGHAGGMIRHDAAGKAKIMIDCVFGIPAPSMGGRRATR